MLIVALLLFSLSSSPSTGRDEFVSAFEAGDVGRLMRLWSAESPTRNADRRRLAEILTERVGLRLETSADDARGVMTLTLRDRTETLLERYELHFKEEGGEWRAWSLVPLESKEPVPAARELLHRGHAYFDAGDLDQALASYQRAAEVAAKTTHAPTRAAAERAIGNIFFNRGEAETAARHFEASMKLAQAANDRREIGRSLDRLALIDRMNGDNARVEARWLEALQIFRDTGDRVLAARALNALGNVHGVQGNFPAAKKYFEESLQIYESLGDALGMSTVLNNLGTDLRGQGLHRDAVAHFHRALELSRSIDDLEGVAYAYGNLGNSLIILGEYVQALHALHQARELLTRLENAEGLANVHLNIGELYRTLGNLEQARDQFESGLALAEKTGWKQAVGIALHNLGQVWLQSGDGKRALEFYEKGMAIDTELGNRGGVAVDLHNIGRVHQKAGDLDAARSAFAKSFAVAEEIGNRETMAISVAKQAELAVDPDEALALAERARTMALELGLNERLWEAHTTLARVHRRAGRLDEARRDAERAVTFVEEIRRGVPGEELAQQAFEGMTAPYHELIGIQVEQRDYAAALENAERAKARVLLDVLQHGRPDLHAALTASEREREASLAAQVVQANNEIRDAEGKVQPAALEKRRKARLEYEGYLTGLYAAHPQLRMERGEMAPARAAEIAALLAGGAADAILAYVVTEERTFVFSITRKGDGLDLRVHTVPIQKKDLEAEVLRFRELLAGRNVTYAAAAQWLYARLILPAAKQLRGKETVCVVPDGPLWELPFQALQPAASEFLLDRHTLYSVPSLTVLRDISKRKPPARAARLLAFGNPVMPAPGTSRMRGELELASLPHTETEIRRIAAMYRNSRVHVGADAREELVKAEARDYDVLHFATHGVLDDHNALYSRLVFSPSSSEKEDGLLEAREIMRLDLRARLAVLSACETARGRIGTGEGLIGMSWALFVAGVPTTVVSQWKVDSASTAELMVELHRALRDGVTIPQALRRAALRTRARTEYRHPFYWAPFGVIGKP